MSIKTIINLLGKLAKWIKDNIVPLLIGGTAGGVAVAVVKQEQTKKAVVESYKKGCEETALAYEKKLREQAEKFLVQKELMQHDIEQYEQLMRAYENEIARLEMIEEKMNEEKKALRLLRIEREKLLKWKSAV